MSYKGIARGKTIELEDELPYPDGQPVSVSVAPFTAPLQPGLPAVVRQAMHDLPHLQWEEVDELERALTEAQLPMQYQGVFDEEERR
jgi:hypothetical protein